MVLLGGQVHRSRPLVGIGEGAGCLLRAATIQLGKSSKHQDSGALVLKLHDLVEGRCVMVSYLNYGTAKNRKQQAKGFSM